MQTLPMNRLTNVESSRVIAVFDEMLHKFHAVRGEVAAGARRRSPAHSPASQLASLDFRGIGEEHFADLDTRTARTLQAQVRRRPVSPRGRVD